jgi:hypothetical protein
MGSRWTARGRSLGLRLKLRLRLLLLLELDRETGDKFRLWLRPCRGTSTCGGDTPFREGDAFGDIGRRGVGVDNCSGERERDGEYLRLS